MKKIFKNMTKRKAIIILVFLVFVFYAITFAITYGRRNDPTIIYTNDKLSGIIDNVVHVNDLDADYYYYKGLNYTKNDTGTLPTGTDQNTYPDSKLVEVQLTYSGVDINSGDRGYVSLGELQDTYIYYKVFPVNDNGTGDETDDFIEIELIENPFTNRPTNKGFNGWVTSHSGVSTTYDSVYYVKKARVPVTYANGKPSKVTVTFNASWTPAAISLVNTGRTWATAFGTINATGMYNLDDYTLSDGYYSMQGYFERVTIARYASYAGYYNASGVYQNSGTCNTQGGCIYYRLIGVEAFVRTNTYYQLIGTMTLVNNNNLPIPQVANYINGFSVTSNMAGYFRQIVVAQYSSIVGYYNNLGDIQTTGTCNTAGGCTYYELIQYYDASDVAEIINPTVTYYYLATRDTNIVVMTTNLSNTWAAAQNKPFTLTSVSNGTDYRGSVTWSTNVVVRAYNDTNIENIKIASGIGVNTASPTTATTTARNLYGSWQNVRIGRGLVRVGTNTSFTTVIGGYSGTTGTSSNTTKYRLIIESGFYSTLSLGWTTGTSNNYIQGKAIYGNDYDRVSNQNNNLIVNFCASGIWGGNIYTTNTTDISVDTTVKSGSFGTSEYDHTTGIYVGGRGAGTFYSARQAKIEGGWIYNLIGGPLTASTRGNYNDAYINVTGGTIDMITGGAGTTATYGHRIVQVTGGKVNYSVFGGSNGYNGSGTDGTVIGSSFVYIGGKAIIGDTTLVSGSQSLFGAEAGSVFGIGNGRSGYPSIGSSSNSNIMITDEAVVNRNVYGGGNFSTTGISSGSSTTTTNITLNGGTVKGDVYGGGNNNGSGNASIASTITINSYDGTVEGSVYGGSNILGTIYGSINMNLYDGIFNSIYGGGRGGYLNASNVGTYVRNNIMMNIGDAATGPTISGNVYGGSAFGSVNIISQATTQSNDSITINFNRGSITGSLFGGGKGDATYDPHVAGNINVNVNNGTIGSVYGGNDANGDLFKNSIIYLNGGTVTNVYGGGNQVQGNISYIYLNGATTTTIYGGSNLSGNVTKAYITATSGSVNTIYGGNNAGGKTLSTDITVNGGTISTIYGGGKLAHTDTSLIKLNATTIPNVYGGGESANMTVSSEILLNGSTITNLYGGSNVTGTVALSKITVTTGNVTNLYGGNNTGGKTTATQVTINGGNVTTVYGGGKLADSDSSDIWLNGGLLDNVYGGGENASMLVDTTIEVNGSVLTRLYGGSNVSGTVALTHVTFNSGNATGVYGGNNAGGNTVTSNVTINGGIITNVYGGGREAATTTSNVIVNRTTGILSQVHGGGHSASVTTANVTVNGGMMTSLYGGSNIIGDVATSNVTVNSQAQSNGAYMSVTYNALDTESWQSTTYPTIITATVTLHNATANIIDEWNGVIFIPESTIYSNSSSTLLAQSGDVYNFNQVNRYSGTNTVPASGTYSFDVTFLTMQDKDEVVFNYNFNGTSTTDLTYSSTSNYIPVIGTVYGGNNAGGTTGNTTININNANVGTVYGGGNQAFVTENTNITITNSSITEYIYGGGNEGGVGMNTNVKVTNTTVGNSVYAGGNGATAVVTGNTELLIDGNSTINEHVFGGGNAAATGTVSNNNSLGVVHITGGNILGNVYGGANTSVLYGTTSVKIGYGFPGITSTERDIHITGTVFGGGEANASGSENYDYSFISVTNGITISIDGNTTNSVSIDGSIFGSGNASSTTGYSSISIKDYGTTAIPKRNISIQRANLVVLDNSHVELFGATDRTNEYSTTLFTISRIKEMKLKNNSSVYLETGANLLEKVSSLVDIATVETKGAVTILEDGDITKNVDNRIYMKEGKNLNIATNESVTAYGEVIGMMFFGMFSRDRDGNVDEAFYSPTYDYGDTVEVGEFYHFSSGSYVLGRHAFEHNIGIDGFYSNYDNEALPGTVDVKYINPTPEDSNYYMWIIGESIASYDISIAASKYSTLGTYELPLLNFYHPNTTFSVVGANFNELAPGFELVRQNQIPRIATDGKADTRMSLVMKTSNTGWITVGETNFLTEEANPIYGTDFYVHENSTVVPSLLFYIYHSKNLVTSGSIGIVTISLIAVTPIDDLTNQVERININIDLSRVLYTTNDYEGAMTAGEEHDMFVTTLTDITNKSKLSAYYSLYAESDTTIYNAGDYRAVVSSFVLPENTKLTMIDLVESTPMYYYYVVTAQDVIAANAEYALHNEASYRLSKFVKMGSSSPGNNYQDSVKNGTYYDPDTDIAHEEFVFIIDYGDTDIQSNKLDSSLLIELRNSGDQTRISVLGIQHLNLMYNMYVNKDAVIELNSTLSKNNIYIGETTNLNVTTNFVQQSINSRTIQDTTFYYQKLGLKLTVYDSADNVVNGVSLMGVTFKYAGVTYYPQMDGVVRINIAPRVANVLAKVEINTKYSNLPSGAYKIKIESFGSPDGIYNGLITSDEEIVNLGVLNNIYGLDVTLPDSGVIVDKTTGTTIVGNNALIFTIDYSSGLTDPNLRLSLKRRKYNTINSTEYEVVDLANYITNTFTRVGATEKYEYLITDDPMANQTQFVYLKDNLVTGTYRFTFSIYDGNNYIGEVYKYVIIK